LTLIDTATGVDAINVISAALKTVADSGAGADQLTITAAIPMTDTGQGLDAIAAISAALTVLDTGAGVDVVIHYDTVARIVKITFTLAKRQITHSMIQREMDFTIKKRTLDFTLN